MCELLGMSANVPTDICFSFSDLRRRGGQTGPHSDGWGISFYEGKRYRTFHDPKPSANSPIATQSLTAEEQWTHFTPRHLYVFERGEQVR